MTGSRYTERMRRGGSDLTGDERSTFGVIGMVCAIAGFFVMGFVLGPIAMVCGRLAMGGRWIGARSARPWWPSSWARSTPSPA